MYNKGIFLLMYIVGLTACTGQSGNQTSPTENKASTSSAATITARPGYKLVEFCDEKYVFEIPQSCDSYHEPDQCRMDIRIPNHAGVDVELVESSRVAEELHDTKDWFENAQQIGPTKVNINGIPFDKTEVRGGGDNNMPQTACLLVSSDEAVLNGYKLVIKCGPDTASNYADDLNVAMTMRKK